MEWPQNALEIDFNLNPFLKQIQAVYHVQGLQEKHESKEDSKNHKYDVTKSWVPWTGDLFMNNSEKQKKSLQYYQICHIYMAVYMPLWVFV